MALSFDLQYLLLTQIKHHTALCEHKLLQPALQQRLCGSGTYADVYGVHENLVIKVAHSGNETALLHEAALLARLQHPYVVPFYGLRFFGPQVALQLARATLDLEQLQQQGLLLLAERRVIFCQLLSALSYLHANGIIHGDVRPENLLMTRVRGAWQLWLADFNIATWSPQNQDSNWRRYTIWYRAPELLLHGTLTTAADIWAAGIVYYYLFAHAQLFTGGLEDEMLMQIHAKFPYADWPSLEHLPNFTHFSQLPLRVRDAVKYPHLAEGDFLCDQMFELNPTRRVSAVALLANPFFLAVPDAARLSSPANISQVILSYRELPVPTQAPLTTSETIHYMNKLNVLNMRRPISLPAQFSAWAYFLATSRVYHQLDKTLLLSTCFYYAGLMRDNIIYSKLEKNTGFVPAILTALRDDWYCTTSYDYLQLLAPVAQLRDTELLLRLLYFLPITQTLPAKTVAQLACALHPDIDENLFAVPDEFAEVPAQLRAISSEINTAAWECHANYLLQLLKRL